MELCAQNAAPAQWPTPSGSRAAMPVQPVVSAPQSIDAFLLKVRSDAIAGDVRPVVADVIPNAPLAASFPFAPLEIAAVVGGKLVTLDASGKTTYRSAVPPFAQAISFVADSSLLPPALRSRLPSLLLLETAEHLARQDSLAVAYVAGYDPTADSVAIITRLTYDLRRYAPNVAAWVRPFFAMPAGSSLAVYAALGMTSPSQQGTIFRGIAGTRVDPALLGGSFPIPDAGDTPTDRWTVAPHVGFDQPSIASLGPNIWMGTLPCTPSRDSVTVATPFGSQTTSTHAYLMAVALNAGLTGEYFPPLELDTILSAPTAKPVVTPYIVELADSGSIRRFLLVAESYSGRPGERGRAQLHLFTSDGRPLTRPSDAERPPFRSEFAHGWSLGVGDLDGSPSNALLPYYPNNPGAELVLTESSRTLAVPRSRLMVLRYWSGTPVPKPSPAGSVLFPLDTIVTFPITGWLAAVADLDSTSDGKAEILLADGDELYALRMRDYSDPRFRTGAPFDTVWQWRSQGEEITNVAIADLDGDRRLDVIVTTTRATSVLGTIPPGALTITAPSDSTICTGDTIALEWHFRYSGARHYTIGVQPYSGLQAIGPRRIIARDTLIAGDTLRLRIRAAELGIARGRLLVWLGADSTIRDSSGMITITPGRLRFDTASVPRQATAGMPITLAGLALCVDTIAFYCSFEPGTAWQPLQATSAHTGGAFVARIEVPCIPFPPLGGQDTVLRICAVGFNDADTVRSDTVLVRVVPSPVVLRIVPQQPVFCCSYSIALESSATPCTTASVYVQYAPSQPWVLLDSTVRDSVLLRSRDGSSDTLRIRWACNGSCGRSDTAIIQPSTRLVQAIVPNPVLRGQELCRIVTAPPQADRIAIRIFDGSDRLVRTLVRDEQRSGGQIYCDVWDCRSDSGELVPPGVYYVLVQASSGWKSFEPVYVR
ncbi:MAG: hypothetical protein D6747_03965 [Chlorobiota bacterium]|nr:MAG: hypothetical protein D6747_03965 [Chlorobiota bacterium]